MTKYSRQRH